MDNLVIIVCVRYARKEKVFDKKASMRQMKEDCALNVLKIVKGSSQDIGKLEDLPCSFTRGKEPWVRKGTVMQLEGHIESLTKRTNIFIAERALVLSKSAVDKVIQKLNFQPQTARENSIKSDGAFLLAEQSLAELPAELYNQDILSIWQFLSQCGFSCDLDRAYEIETYFHRRAVVRGFPNVLTMLKQNPFILIDLPGFSVSILKNVLKKFNISVAPEIILQAQISSILNSDARRGHAYTPLAMLATKLSNELDSLNIVSEQRSHYLAHLAENLPSNSLSYTLCSGKDNPHGFENDIKTYYHDAFIGNSNINKLNWRVRHASVGMYLKKIFFNEKTAAEELFKRSGQSVLSSFMLKEVSLFNLYTEQKQALIMALTYKVSVLIGSAGTGKTYTVRTLIKLLKKYGYEAVILAPSAMAAALAAKESDCDYQTIHRFARILPEDEDLGEVKDLPKQDVTINSDLKFIIIDEMSMCTIPMFANFLAAIKKYPYIRLLLVGDICQLPAIGPRFFDQVESGVLGKTIPITRLTQNKRSKSSLINFANNIRCGNKLSKAKNVIFYKNSVLDYIKDNTDHIKNDNVLFLADKKVGKYGTNKLNSVLRTLFLDQSTKNIDSTDFYIGDPIITIKNDYYDTKKTLPYKNKDRQIDIYNGTRGHIIGFADDSKNVIIVELELPEGKCKTYYNVWELGSYMEVSYAITVHSVKRSHEDKSMGIA